MAKSTFVQLFPVSYENLFLSSVCVICSVHSLGALIALSLGQYVCLLPLGNMSRLQWVSGGTLRCNNNGFLMDCLCLFLWLILGKWKNGQYGCCCCCLLIFIRWNWQLTLLLLRLLMLRKTFLFKKGLLKAAIWPVLNDHTGLLKRGCCCWEAAVMINVRSNLGSVCEFQLNGPLPRLSFVLAWLCWTLQREFSAATVIYQFWPL